MKSLGEERDFHIESICYISIDGEKCRKSKGSVRFIL